MPEPTAWSPSRSTTGLPCVPESHLGVGEFHRAHQLSYFGPRADTFPLLAAALERRRRLGIAPFTVLSCDNLPRNGSAARTALVAAAGRRDPCVPDSLVFYSAVVSA
ncbi:hypothetical protein [Kribbella sp. NPDC006257]|uniref:hypothetical protein n=1 Tax=Kribbella sp. NPDC006257 TaxID=3156738 RepID=UPI0033BC483F